ncbi:UNVERIFIED_CONTAM: hypothetical protein Scaly_0025800 [Sesamum calycinum]|uniref:Uncharacterized protein n=1 Tax=Sesamum calycinum TaxID=2727403 RepID=A0AAW2SU08_9LAMI
MKREDKESWNYKSSKRYGMTLMRIQRSTKKRQKHSTIVSKEFNIGQKVLLFHSKLKLFPGKLRSRWIGPFIVTNVFPHGAVEIKSLTTQKVKNHKSPPSIGRPPTPTHATTPPANQLEPSPLRRRPISAADPRSRNRCRLRQEPSPPLTHDPPDNSASAATVRRSPPSSATVIFSYPHLLSIHLYLVDGRKMSNQKRNREEGSPPDRDHDHEVTDAQACYPHPLELSAATSTSKLEPPETAIKLGVFDPDCHNLHLACHLEPLDMACLSRMGLVTYNGNFFEFVNAEKSSTTPSRRSLVDESDETEEETENDQTENDEEEESDESEASKKKQRMLARMKPRKGMTHTWRTWLELQHTNKPRWTTSHGA